MQDWLLTVCVAGGGCTVPFGRGAPSGVDCTALRGVEDVSCVDGGCVVRSCADGYAKSADGSACVLAAGGLVPGAIVEGVIGLM